MTQLPAGWWILPAALLGMGCWAVIVSWIVGWLA